MNARKHLVPAAIWTVLWGIFFFSLLRGAKLLPTSDFTEQFHAFATFQAREMLQGHLPLWSPHSYAGIPFVADPQAAVFYLPRWLTILLSAPWGLSLYALELEALLHVWLAGAFMYILAHSITGNRWASLLGALVLGLGGYLVSYPLLQLAILETIAWLPLLLFLVRRGVERRAMPWFVAAGGVLALSATAGHPQTFLHVVYAAAAYFLFLTIRERWTWKWLLRSGIIIAVIGAGAAAAYWLPVLRYQALSTRADVSYDFVAAGEPLLNFLQVLIPFSLSIWSPEYVGIAGIFLVCIAWLAREEDKHQKSEIVFWVVFTVLASWIALGDAGILFELVYHVAPGFSLFRQQERLLGIANVGAALLAAQGLALWFRLGSARRHYVLRVLGLTFLILFALATVVLIATRAEPEAGWPFTLARQVLVAVIVLIVLGVVRAQQTQALLLILLLFGDLFVAGQSSLRLQEAGQAAYWQEPQWLETLLSATSPASPYRVDTENVLWSNSGEIYGWEDVRGISPLKPQLLEAFERLPRARRWRLLNVNRVLASQPLTDPAVTLLQEFDGGIIADRPRSGFIYEVNDPMPRAWMVYDPVVVADRGAALAVLAEETFDPAAQVVLTPPAANASSIGEPPPTPPRVQIHSERPGILGIDVETATDGFLVISEWRYPGWQARMDGEAVALEAADADLLGLYVPAGAHTLRLHFSPVVVPLGITISLLAIAAAAVLLWRWQPTIETRPRAVSRTPPAWTRPKLPSLARWRDRLHGRVLALAVVFVGFTLRIHRLGVQELRGDEGVSYIYALEPWRQIIASLHDVGDPHSPFHYLLLRGWILLAGQSEFAMRYISLVPGVLALPLTYQVGRRLFKRRFGLLAAGLMAIAQGLVWMSQDARNQYMLAVVFALVATLLLLEAVRSRHWAWWVAYAVAAALTVYAHFYGVFALLAHGAYLLALQRKRGLLARWLVSGVGAALLFLPWMLYSLPTMISVGNHFGTPTSPDLGRHLTAVGRELALGTGIDGDVARWLFLGMLLLALSGGFYLWRQRRAAAVLLFTWLLGAAMGIYLIRFSRGIFNTFYIDVAGPAWWMLVAAGIVALGSERKLSFVVARWASLLFVVSVLGLSLAHYYFNPAYSRAPAFRQTATILADAVEADDVIVTNYPDPSLSYYLRHLETPKVIQPASYQGQDGQTEANLRELAQEYERMWFVPAHGAEWDPEEIAFRWFDYHALLARKIVVAEKVTLLLYRPLRTAPSVMTPLQQTMRNGIRLEAAYITVNGDPLSLQSATPEPIAAGSTLEVTLLWRALDPVPSNYTVFVHVLDENGQLIAQHDGVAAFGTRPTVEWEQGELILDKHRITLPQGMRGFDGTIQVGMYDSETLARQQFDNGDEVVRLADYTTIAPR